MTCRDYRLCGNYVLLSAVFTVSWNNQSEESSRGQNVCLIISLHSKTNTSLTMTFFRLAIFAVFATSVQGKTNEDQKATSKLMVHVSCVRF